MCCTCCIGHLVRSTWRRRSRCRSCSGTSRSTSRVPSRCGAGPSGMLANVISQTGSTCSRWLPRIAAVEFATLDESLDDRIGPDRLVDELHAFAQVRLVVHHRRLRDADRRFLRQRLDDHRERAGAWAGALCGRARRPRTRASECGGSAAASSRAPCRAPRNMPRGLQPVYGSRSNSR